MLFFSNQQRMRNRDVQVERNKQLVNMMKKFPFTSIMFNKSNSEFECAICLEQFKEYDNHGNETQVVQLKCSKYHIFHFDCFREYLEFV